jgi:hypothetical protein
MTRTSYLIAAFVMMVAAAAFMGCTSTADTQDGPGSAAGQQMPPGGNSTGLQNGPPSGMGPGGSGGPGGSSDSSSYTFSGTYTLNGGTATQTGQTYTSTTKDVSGVYVTNGGVLTLVNPTITTSGDSSSNDASSFYGLNGAVLVNNGSSVTITGGSISSTGSGANGVIPTGTGSSATLTDVSITASGNGAHGVMATQGGTLTLNNVTIVTSGGSAAPLATDRGSGTVTVNGGTMISGSGNSPCIYSTGVITVTGAKMTSTGSEAAVIEGFNSIVLKDTEIAGYAGSTGAVMIYQSMSGDASTGTGTFTMTGGSLSTGGGPIFFVTNTDGVITLFGVTVISDSDTLISAAGTSRWGTSGSNGGIVSFTADGETLSGNVVTDSISSAALTLQNKTSLSGSINTAALTLDATSTWIVTNDSVLTSLSDASGISGTSITNIYGNGHTVTYDSGLSANSAFGGKTYTLNGGGTLKPA